MMTSGSLPPRSRTQLSSNLFPRGVLKISTKRHAARALARAAPSFISSSSLVSFMAWSCLSRPQPFQLAPPHRAFLGDAGVALGEDVEFLLLRKQFHVDAVAHRLLWQADERLLQFGEPPLGRARCALPYCVSILCRKARSVVLSEVFPGSTS